MARLSARYIEDLARQWEPRLRDAFLNGVRTVATAADLSTIARLIEQGRVEDAIRAVGVDPSVFSSLSLQMQGVYAEGGMQASGGISSGAPRGLRASVFFNVRDPIAEQWVRERSSTLIQNITTDQRLTIRNFLQHGIEVGQNPRTTALNLVGRIDPETGLRSGGVLGLASNQEGFAANYAQDLASSDPAAWRRLLERGLRDRRYDTAVLRAIRDKTPIPAATRERMRIAYYNRLLLWRAENIARTESLRALGAAQTEAFRQAFDKGVIHQTQVRRFWVTAGDERVRHTHRLIPGMNKDGVGWDQLFETPTGPSLHAPHDRDPQCRCRERLKIDYISSAARALRRGP